MEEVIPRRRRNNQYRANRTHRRARGNRRTDYDYERNNDYNEDNNNKLPLLESILTNLEVYDDYKLEEKENKLILYDFKKINISKLEEDILYYCSSPKTLLNFKSNIDDEKNYEFYNDIDSENFMAYQKDVFKQILSLSKSNKYPLTKECKLSNYKNSFCVNASLVEESDKTELKLVNSNIIRTKLGELSNKIINEIDSNKIMEYLKELKDNFKNHIIDMESLGLIQFNFIENNLTLLLNLIKNKFEQEKNTKFLGNFILICLDILKYFKSSNIYFYIIKNLNHYKQKYGDSFNFKLDDNTIQFIPNNCFNFDFFTNNVLIQNIEQLFKLNDIPFYRDYSQNKLFFKDNQIRTVNYENYLLIFFLSFENIYKKDDYILCLKFNIINEKLIYFKKIQVFFAFFEDGKEKTITDLNISLKDGIIYFLYIFKENKKNIRYQLYSANDISLLRSNTIELKDTIIPKTIFNDSQYFYCFTETSEVIRIKKNYKLDNLEYINCSIRLYNEDNIKTYNASQNNFKMLNSLCINSLFVVTTKENQYIGKIIFSHDNNYILNLYKLNNTISFSKISYNDNRFIIICIDKEINDSGSSRKKKDIYNIYMNVSYQDCNLIDKNIKLLPFNYNCYSNFCPNDLYEYLLEEYSSFLNLCGNFDLINNKKEHNLIKYPFSLCCNFEQNNLDFIIENIIKNEKYDNMKLYYIIILKQIICCLYNGNLFNQEKINNIIPYFKNLIINVIKNEGKENKIFNEILKEIIIISTYIQNNLIIDIKDIDFALNEEYKNIDFKTKLLLVELLLEQNKTRNKKELYDYIIQLEKNYLINILKNIDDEKDENLDISNYYYFKNVMIKASETMFLLSEHLKKELISLIPILSSYIQEICELYKKILDEKKIENPKYKIFYIYNSFIFRIFYLIIEKILASENLIKGKEIISSIYKVLITLDKLSINIKESDYYDMNNIININNYSFYKNDGDYNRYYSSQQTVIDIKVEYLDSIIIKIYGELPENSIFITLFRNINEKIKYDFGEDFIYNKIKKISITNYRESRDSKDNFCIKIIPLKNANGYYSFQNNQDFKIIILIQKIIISYLLFLFKDIHTKIDKYNNDKIIKNQSKLFQTNLLRFMSFNENDSLNNNKIITSPLIEETSKLIKNLNLSFDNKISNINDFQDNLNSIFAEANEKMKLNFINNYKNKIKNINKLQALKNQEKCKIEEKKYDKLFSIFQYNLSCKKNLLINKIKNNEKLDSLIAKIFLFGIKYYNYLDKLVPLIKEIEAYKKEDIKDNINKIQSIKNYSLFYSFYEASSRMKLIYQEQKSGFSDSNFEQDMEKYFEEKIQKIEFLYQNIIPSDDSTIEPNISVINNVLSFLENKEISINEIEQYCMIQNINSKIKLIELTIINNLLLNMNNESIIIFLSYLISKIIRNVHNKLNSFVENTNCVDFFIMEKLKYQFHLFLHILSYKIINGKNQYSVITQISLTENLLWKIRGRNFPILLEIMKAFEDIKTAKIPELQCDDAFSLEFDKIYNVSYLNKRKNIETKFEIFKILVKEIMIKIKDILQSDDDNKFKLERNPSNVSETDYRELFKIIISYFSDINPECIYYNDIILFFYKIFINSEIIQNFLLSSYPNIISKIMKIAFGIEKYDNNKKEIKDKFNNNDSNNDSQNRNLRGRGRGGRGSRGYRSRGRGRGGRGRGGRFEYIENLNEGSRSLKNIYLEKNSEKDNENNSHIRLIMLKLLCQIIENTKNDLDNLSKCIRICEKGNMTFENPFLYLYEKISNDNLNNNKDNIISCYYNKLLLICLNKIFESNKNGDDISKLIKNKFELIISLIFNNNFSYMSENEFIIKTHHSLKFEKEALFNSEEKRKNKKGKIISFLSYAKLKPKSYYYYYYQYDYYDDDYNNANYIYLDFDNIKSYLSNNSINIFDKELFKYNIKEDSNYDENKDVLVIMEDNEKSEIYNINKIETKDINEITIIKQDNIYEKIFIENNFKLIIDIIKDKMKKDNLNEKGISIILNLLSKLMTNINKDDLLFIFNYFWKYYELNKIEENNFIFMSMEFIEDYLNKNLYSNSLYYKNIYKDKNKSKVLWSLFNCEINDNYLKIYLKKNNIKYFQYPITSVNKTENVYYKLENLSFYKCHDIYIEENLNNNSILFTQSITDDIILELGKIFEKDDFKNIKIIIANKISAKNPEIDNFEKKNNVIIYQLAQDYYKILIEFFIEGKGINYPYLPQKKYFCIKGNSNNEQNRGNYNINNGQNRRNNNLNNYEYEDEDERFIDDYEDNNYGDDFEDFNIENNEEIIIDISQETELSRQNLNKDEILEDFKNNREKIFNEIENDLPTIHKLLNLKLIKRLIYDILCHDSIKIFELEKIFGNYEHLVYIYETLCMEYYFNNQENLQNEILKKKLKNYLLIVPSKENENKSNPWIISYINKCILISDTNIINYEKYLQNFDITKLNNEKKLINKYFNLYNNIAYDKLLFLSNHFDKISNKEYFIKIFFNALSNISQNVSLKNQTEKLEGEDIISFSDERNEADKFVLLFLSKIMNILYDYYININDLNSINNKIYEKSILSSNIHKIMKVLIEEKVDLIEQIDDYDYDDPYIYGVRGAGRGRRPRARRRDRRIRGIIDSKKQSKQLAEKKSLLFSYIFKYFDFCLILYFREQNIDILNYWINSKNKLFEFYIDFKILSLEKNYQKNDFKEIISLIALYTDIIKCFDKESNNIFEDSIFKMKINEMNKYQINDNNNLIIKNVLNKNDENINKLCVLCLENETDQKYILQDIIDLKDLKKLNKKYKLRINKDIFLVPVKNINTSLYSFDHCFSSVFNNLLNYYNVKNKFEFENLRKIEQVPKYSWNIGYGKNALFLLSEDDNKIYTFYLDEETTRNSKFILDEKINGIITEKNKIIDFVQGPTNAPPFLLDENGEIYCFDEKKYNYKWLNKNERKSSEYILKIKIPLEIKIVSLSVTYNECYIVDQFGQLYENANIIEPRYTSYYERHMQREWKLLNIDSDKSFKFVQCSCGDGYVICLEKDNEGKGRIYAKGNNSVYQCGIDLSEGISSNIRGKLIAKLTQCDETENLDFRAIYANNNFSAAITEDYKLYIWGLKDKDDFNITPISRPTLVNIDSDKDFIIEDVSLGYNKLFAIGRILENGNYVRKLFYLETNKSKNDKNEKKDRFILKEVKIMNILENNSRIVPVKVLIGDTKVFILTVNEGDLIKEINEYSKNKAEINNEIAINIDKNRKINNFEKIKGFYISDNCNKFMDSFNSISDKNIEKVVRALEEIKKKDNLEESIDIIELKELIKYIEENKEMKDLLDVFNNEKGNILFQYLKVRISLFQKNFQKYFLGDSSFKFEGFLKKMILNNIIYMLEEKRISYFNELLTELQGRGYGGKRVNINRFKANEFYDKFNSSSEKIPDIELNETIFGQLFHQYENEEGFNFILPKNQRLFNVELLGEGAIDAGGPYHEAISFMCNELQSDYLELFIKTPNNKYNIGELRDKYIVNPDANKNINEKAYIFIGKMMAMAISTGESFNLNLHPIIWKSLLEQEISFEEYRTIDFSFYSSINDLEKQFKQKDSNIFLDFYFVIKNSNESDVELVENGKGIKTTKDNLEKYLNLVKSTRINEIKNQIKYIQKGLFSAIDKNIIQILNWNQLEEMVCGKNKMDISDFKTHTVYQGYKENDQTIIWFWKWLEQSKDEIQFKYLKFVSGRTRLPKSGFGYTYTHTITKIGIGNKYPKAATCFFTLKLPPFEDEKEFIEKIEYAIENCTDISDH